jgi:hypothetical protein
MIVRQSMTEVPDYSGEAITVDDFKLAVGMNHLLYSNGEVLIVRTAA